MALMATDSGGKKGFDPCPQGSHIARLVTIVDLGLQNTPWGTREEVYLGFEVPGVRVAWTDREGTEKQGTALIGATWTLSLYEEANLGKNLRSWSGREFTEEEKRNGFDLFQLLGKPCMLSVVHNKSSKTGKVYANISAIIGVPAGTEIPPQENDSLGYSEQDDEYAGNLDKLPPWLAEKARNGSRQMLPEDQSDKADPEAFDDDIPF